MLKLRDYTRKRDKLYLITRTCIKPTNKLVSSHSETLAMLGRTTGDLGLTRLTTARTRGKPPPSPIQYSLRYSIAPTSKWHFFPGFPRRGPETIRVWTPDALVAHNSLLKPPIRMRSEANLQLSLRAFQRCVALHLHTPGLGRFPTFSGRGSNC